MCFVFVVGLQLSHGPNSNGPKSKRLNTIFKGDRSDGGGKVKFSILFYGGGGMDILLSQS